ncbi:MAG TPA: hypothetical protein VK140_02565 [Ktedonobacteraceae bacterium]|nr:hypothetical protein [Ktedonobacteraceae bacterium]
MAFFDELDEEQQKQWHSRIARKRLDLSASVEEALIDSSIQEDQWADEVDDSAAVPASKGTALVPPRLSLQSKQLPAVRPHAAGAAKSLPNPSDGREPGATSTENANILARFAQRISSSLASLGGALQPTTPAAIEGKQSSPKSEVGTPAQPVAHIAQKERAVSSQTASSRGAITRSTTEVARPVESNPRLARRTTKVRLQVVPKPEATEKLADKAATVYEAVTNPSMPSLPIAERLEIRAGTIAHEAREGLSGSGVFESGQSDVAVANTLITPSSVVVVVLTGDPGPVVVQYISLQNKAGFTVHLSAPTKNTTPFNYRIM